MRILLVNKLYAPEIGGGAEIVLENIARGMVARGHTVLVATTTSQDHELDEAQNGVSITRIPLQNIYWHRDDNRQPVLKRLVWHFKDSHNAAMGLALQAVIEKTNPDVVMFHNITGFSASAWDAAFIHGKPTVQVLHDYYNICPRSQMFKGGENCINTCTECQLFRIGRSAKSDKLTAVVGVSNAILQKHLANGLFKAVGIQRIIANARPGLEALPKANLNTARVFGFIGTIAEWKGIRSLLEAFKQFLESGSAPDVRLIVAGDGELKYVDELKSAYASHRIEFIGRVSPELFYRRVDVTIVPSIWNDPLPSVVYESFLCGVPVIGARRGGIPEMVVHGENGLLYEPDEPGSLIDCITQLSTVPDLASTYGRSALGSSAPYGDMGRVVDAHIDVCQAAVASRLT